MGANVNLSRRKLLGSAVLAAPLLKSAIVSCAMAAEAAPLNDVAGVDRVAVLPGKTYLRGWAGYGEQPRPGRPGRGAPPPPPPPTGPAFTTGWSKVSGPGAVKFEDPKALVTTATFTAPGAYVLKLTANNGQATANSTLNVVVEPAPPAKPLEPVWTNRYRIESPLWNARIKALMVNWIPHCIEYINRTDLTLGPGGIDNFVEAGKKLRGEPHGAHKGYVFSNAWVHQTVESMSIALMIDPKGDPEIVKAHQTMRATLEDWIPKILSAQEPDGYLQTAFTLPRVDGRGRVDNGPFKHWERRGDHEGYVGGYFIESAINHYTMTEGKDARLYNAAKKLADCWYNNIGPAPKKPWYDGHQQMEQALVRFGRFVEHVEGPGKGRNYIQLAKFLLDCRYEAAANERERQDYDQSHLPVVQQYEALGHAVRAAYTYSGMADIAMETRDPGYQSAVRSLWDNMVNRKLYLTGGIGSVGSNEGFGPNYSLTNRGYCEACSTCGTIFLHWKMNLAYHDAKYADAYEDAIYNALLGSTDLEARNFYYTNPLDETVPRAPWHQCPCCVGNIPRTLMMLPTWTYLKGQDGIYVNLFIGSTATIEKVDGVDVELTQVTEYPRDGRVAITVKPKSAKAFALRIRIPNRNISALYKNTPQVNGVTRLAVNGSVVKPAIEKGYAVIRRTWKAGDKVELEVPMKAQRVHADERIEADRNKVALRYGPLVYNIEAVDQDITKVLKPDAPLKEEWKPDLLGGVMTLRSSFADGSPLLAIPHYVRMNREPQAPPTQAPPPAQPAQGQRPAPRPSKSIVWINEA